jgi:hypothetical protein
MGRAPVGRWAGLAKGSWARHRRLPKAVRPSGSAAPSALAGDDCRQSAYRRCGTRCSPTTRLGRRLSHGTGGAMTHRGRGGVEWGRALRWHLCAGGGYAWLCSRRRGGSSATGEMSDNRSGSDHMTAELGRDGDTSDGSCATAGTGGPRQRERLRRLQLRMKELIVRGGASRWVVALW